MTAHRGRRSEHNAGSPQTGEPVFIAVGRIRRPHGLSGEVLVEILTDFPERIVPGMLLYVGENRSTMYIKTSRPHHKGLLLSFEGITDPVQAGAYRNQMLCVFADDRPELPDGEYYHHQLLGLQVITDQGQMLGVLADILQTGSNDVYIVRSDAGADILLPAIDSVMLNVDLDRKEMVVHLLPGLIPE